MTETAHRGSCLCGSIRYETTAALQAASHCHCTLCRKAHGAAFATYGSVRREHHRFVQGADQVRAYRSSAHITRFFCPACGSPLLGTAMRATRLGGGAAGIAGHAVAGATNPAPACRHPGALGRDG